jgi:hypothetical protein
VSSAEVVGFRVGWRGYAGGGTVCVGCIGVTVGAGSAASPMAGLVIWSWDSFHHVSRQLQMHLCCGIPRIGWSVGSYGLHGSMRSNGLHVVACRPVTAVAGGICGW